MVFPGSGCGTFIYLDYESHVRNLKQCAERTWAYIYEYFLAGQQGAGLSGSCLCLHLEGISLGHDHDPGRFAKDYYEAAKIDGASKLAQFRYITVPSLKPILTTVLILDCVWWFKQYTLVYTMTAGGPGTATNLISLSIYGTAFNDLRFGKASAWGILVFFICYLISLVSKVVTKENE